MPDPAPADYVQEYLDRGGDRLGLHIYPDPAGGDTTALVIVWPAMGAPARYYRPLAAHLLDQGLGVVVVDLRGTGASTPPPSRASRYGYAELAGDVGAVLAALTPRLRGRPVILLGHSLGGQACLLHLALAAAAPAPEVAGVDGCVLVAVGLPWWRSYPGWHKLRVLVLTQWVAGVAAVLRFWPGWGFGGRQPYPIMRDWGHTARTGRFPARAGVDLETALAGVRTPVLAISVESDQYTPPPTTDHLCRKLSAAAVERVHLTAAEAGAPLDHFVWVRASRAVASRVAAFTGRAGADRTS